MGRIVNLFHLLSRWCAYLGVVSLSIAMLVTVADVALRAITRMSNWFLDTPMGLAVPGVVDLVQLFVMGAVFMSIPFAFMADAHVCVDLLTARLGARRESFFKGIAAFCSAAFMTAVLYYGWAQAQMQIEFGDSSSTLEIPMLWFWVVLLAGAASSIVATLLTGIHQLLTVFGASSHRVDPSRIVQGE